MSALADESDASSPAQSSAPPPPPPPPLSDAAAAVLRLQDTERSAKRQRNGDGTYAKLWLELFLNVDLEECLRVRCAVASNLCFRARDGAHLDVQFVRRHLSPADDARLLARLATAARHAPQTSGFRVASDLDDTIVPGGYGALGVAGCDTTAPRGSFYAGCAALHGELRPGGYSTLLTARPPRLVRALVASDRGAELLRALGPRLGLSPGASRTSEVGANLKNILAARVGERARRFESLAAYDAHARRRYGGLADHKVREFADWAAAYPDGDGRFVFVGDDHQGDYLVARRLLRLACAAPGGAEGATRPLLAFAAIKHARRRGEPPDRDALPPAVLAEMVDETRGAAGGDARFFVFDSYHDLAAQLHAAGWLDRDAKNRVVEASAQEQQANDFFG